MGVKGVDTRRTKELTKQSFTLRKVIVKSQVSLGSDPTVLWDLGKISLKCCFLIPKTGLW